MAVQMFVRELSPLNIDVGVFHLQSPVGSRGVDMLGLESAQLNVMSHVLGQRNVTCASGCSWRYTAPWDWESLASIQQQLLISFLQ